jgi:hypothetical protein
MAITPMAPLETVLTPLHASVAHDPSDPPAEPAGEETLAAHAIRVLRASIGARVAAVLDAAIAALQKLRQKAGDTAPAEEADERLVARREHGPRRVETPASEPPPRRRRLRATLLYAGVMLAGIAAGGAIAYGQFQQQVDRLFETSQRRERALAQKTRPTAEIQRALDDEQARRAQAEAKLAASLTAFSNTSSRSFAVLETLLGEQLAEGRRLEAALSESVRATAAAKKALAEEQARRAQAEQKLAAASAEYARALHDKDHRLAAAEDQRRDGAHDVPPAQRTRRSPQPTRAGNCTLDANNLGALKGCIDDFNR